jgi:hypothetical protein
MSNQVKSLLRNRVLVAVLAVLALALLLTSRATPNTNARLRQEHDIFYYTDATYTVQCGYYIFPCYGSVHQSGCVTQYYEEDWYDCFAGDRTK